MDSKTALMINARITQPEGIARDNMQLCINGFHSSNAD